MVTACTARRAETESHAMVLVRDLPSGIDPCQDERRIRAQTKITAHLKQTNKHRRKKTIMSDNSLKVPSKLDLEYLKEGTVHQAMKMHDLLVLSNNTQAEVTKEAL